MTVKMNDAGFKHAKQLIQDGKVARDTDWSERQPSSDQTNSFLKDHSWDDFSKWFLAVNSEYDKDDKSHYEFPYGDFKKVHRAGVIAAKQRAAQYDHSDVEKAADKLLEMIDAKSES